ncbi:fatty acyl-AMP ligase [Sorangium sp. So ce260]|uniref:fatty acyl-AMP ligase n=1 Tax=Sorangium sp. So ce260 TaxID=3133291 RepID=UPI003F60D61E
MRPNHTTLVGLLREKALRIPEETAFRFLNNDGSEQDGSTFAQLDQQARAIAAELQRRMAPGDRALLLFPPGLDFIAAFFGCLYAGVIGVPVYPARDKRGISRLEGVLRSAEGKVVLSTGLVMEMTSAILSEVPEFSSLQWLNSATLVSEERSRDWKEPKLSEGSVAFLQYTSGSTGTPRGVTVSHGNLLHNQRMIQAAFQHDPDLTTVVGWLPVYHDMGLIGNVLQPLYLGRPCILLSPLDFLQRPLLWLQAISRYRATTSGGPNFAYELCVRRISAEQRQELDLSTWGLAFNGAEPIRADVLERFSETFAPQGFRREAFYPCYGLAEATLFASGGDKAAPVSTCSVSRGQLEEGRVVFVGAQDADARVLVNCGHAWQGQQMIIVDPEHLTTCPEGQVGEVWLAGPSVAQGYWNQPDATRQTFQAHLADSGEGPFLRTGDLGFMRGGDLFITGRLKDVLIIRGRNHYPEDIELTVERSNAALRPGCGAAFSVEIEGEERLVVVQEISKTALKTADRREVVADIREAITAHHGLRLHAAALLMPATIPKTSSGKIQRRVCKAKYLDGTLKQVPVEGNEL